jgi:hypothetical protein
VIRRLTDADTALGNFVLCTLAIAAVLAWFL